jgi:hypothetical protein
MKSELPDWLKSSVELGSRGKAPEQTTLPDQITARTNYKTKLFLALNPPNDDYFPTSTGNVTQYNDIDYENTILEYKFPVALGDKIDVNDCNKGHKIHLNVAPQFVLEVSNYLKENKYHHKYLSGGDASDGKIFTIYLGSHNNAYNRSKIISQELDGKLLKPLDKSEIEYAPNICGRFCARSIRFHQYPNPHTRGMSALRQCCFSTYRKNYTADEIKYDFNITYEALADEFGVLFHG